MVLGYTSEYRTLRHLFEIGRSTVCEIVQETCKSIIEHLLPKYICFSSSENLNTIVDGFEQKWSIPQCIGAIDGAHVP